MRADRRRSIIVLLGAAGLSSAIALAPSALAQVPPLVATTTTTTPASSSTTSGPSGSDLSNGANEAPDGAADAKGDGAEPPAGGIAVPPDAQAVISSVRRTSPSDNRALLVSLTGLQELGLSQAETYRVGLGRFPIAGAAHYSHDWLYPRYGPGFRFHLGCDVFAAYGTPVRAPVDGVARASSNSLGGLTVKVVMPDATYFYLAHLSGLAPGFEDGMPVRTGDIVGFVGDSGNARGGAPHLHIGIYPNGGDPIDPKPILDAFLAEAQARVPELVAAYQRARPVAAPAVEDEPRLLRPMLATDLLPPLAAGGADYVTGASPLVGP